MEYELCSELQKRLLDKVAREEQPDTLLFVEHEPVLTLGANFHRENLLLDDNAYELEGIKLIDTDRGGDVTYHGPNQLVIYPIFNITHFGKDLHKWLRDLEEAVIVALRAFGLEGDRFPPNTGVWVKQRKIAAIGIKVKRWTSMHGVALNCNNDLHPFTMIVPCGIKDFGVTNLSQELDRNVGIDEAMPVVRQAFEDVFGLKLQQKTRAEIEAELG